VFFAQVATDSNFWNSQAGDGSVWLKMLMGFGIGIALLFAFLKAPTQLRRPIVFFFTFIAGLFYVLLYFWPNPVKREPGTLPRDFVENIGFKLEDGVNIVVPITNILTAFLLGLGIYSVLRIHLAKVAKKQRDWSFSLVLLVSMFVMIIFGYWDWNMTHANPAVYELQSNWQFPNYGRDLLFNGLLQTMDAGMFSIIAFYILSAAYRAFRARSVEATILLVTALVVILSLLGAVTYFMDGVLGNPKPTDFVSNFTLTSISKWIRDTFQNSSLRGVDFGVGIGALAMGLRLWLNLERTGGN